MRCLQTCLHIVGHMLMRDIMRAATLLASELRGLARLTTHQCVLLCLVVLCCSSQLSRMHVPESALNGHAYHTYQLTSPDGSVMFEFQHNVVGRTTYAEGTVDACLFLQSQIEAKSQRTLFNMVDVLKAGAMR